MKTIVTIVLSLLMLTACANTDDVQMSQYENKAIQEIAQVEGQRVADVKSAHENTLITIAGSGATPAEIVLGSALVSVSFSEAAKSQLPEILKNFKRDTKTTDLGVKALETAEGIAWPIATVRIVDTFGDSTGDSIYNNEGDVTNSGNRPESKTVVLGDGNSGQSTSLEKDNDKSIDNTPAPVF